jgi:hypothetical protein
MATLRRALSLTTLLLLSCSCTTSTVRATPLKRLPTLKQVSVQPLVAQVRRLIEALDYLGNPLPQTVKEGLNRALQEPNEQEALRKIQALLDPHCLFYVQINPESRVKVAQGSAKPELLEAGWRQFLVKVQNQAGVTAELKATSPNAQSLYNSPKSDLRDRWLDMQMFNGQPLKKQLSGLELEYRIVQLYSKDAGKREAKISFNVGQGTQDLGFRSEADVLFSCVPTKELTFRVRDEENKPTMAMFLIKDKQGRVYPSQTKRLAPDFAFHPQVYRADGERIKLPPGEYTVVCKRGPEYLEQTQRLTMSSRPKSLSVALKRWVDPAKQGWWSGDHHIHAAGCAHYTNPTEGVHAPDMMRHCLGEDLKVGCNLTWGPCFDYQKQFFTGKDDKVSRYPYLLRYDIEVSGFGSHESGHLCLLRLKDQMYPGGNSSKHWPKLCLNTLRWAKAQGAVCGPAHSGFGLEPSSFDLPSYTVPAFNSIGAMEYIADVTHLLPGPDGALVPAVDFISTVDTPYLSELNIWYHTLNCGYRTRISGETDFPCITGERVGVGRSYVKLDNKLDYESWCEGIRNGRSYVSDGRSHLIGFRVQDRNVGEQGSEVALNAPGEVEISAQISALLDTTPDRSISKTDPNRWPYWHLEKARIGESREVPVEVIVNGYPVARQNIVADGTARDMKFRVKITQSSWVALRILGSSHTNPVFVLVGGKPIRASRRSAEWCRKSVDQCWSQKQRFIGKDEMEEAIRVYDHARQAYQRIESECLTE